MSNRKNALFLTSTTPSQQEMSSEIQQQVMVLMPRLVETKETERKTVEEEEHQRCAEEEEVWRCELEYEELE